MTTTTQQAPIVTVVIPVYNSEATLARAIGSARCQTLAGIEIIVVDDGSVDTSRAIASRAANEDPRVRVLAMPGNGGKPRAMNAAAAQARGTWLAVLDADDAYLPDRLAVLVEAGEAHGADVVADNQLHLDDATGQVARAAFSAPGPGRAVGLADFIAHSDPGAPFDFGILKPMVRLDFVRASHVEYHPEARLAEDFYYLLELFVAGARGWLVHQPLYEWTLPFSPSARRWTATGSGAWRYDYRHALQTNAHFRAKLGGAGPDVAALLARRERDYGVMVHYLDAQRTLAETGKFSRAAAIILTHPTTWRLLASRVAGRLARRMQRRQPAVGAGAGR